MLSGSDWRELRNQVVKAGSFLWRGVLLFSITVTLVSCGKNDGIRVVPFTNGPNPYLVPQAPAPTTFAPPAQFPNGFSGGYSPYFSPQIPQGYGAGYYPFLPIHQYMNQNPYLANYWQQYWNGWTTYAGNRGYQMYDFNRFWLEYCPQQWSYSPWADFYQYYDQNYYFWLTPQTQFPTSANPAYFWQYYQ